MRYPKFLKPGGTIGFIAPSFGCTLEPYKTRFENAIRIFEEMGYKTWLGPNCYADSGFGISNRPELCGAELNGAMTDDAIDVVMACGGGELMCEVVPFIDFEKISLAEPKWYMGYSDNTNYTFLSAVLADTATIYGPCAPTFGRVPWHNSLDDFLKLLTGESLTVSGYDLWERDDDVVTGTGDEKEEMSVPTEPDPLAPYNVTEKTEYKYFNTNDVPEAELTGRLLGGCLDILTLHVGTKYDKVKEFAEKYKEDGIIWFIEACDLDILSMRRALWQMREAGWFKYVKGFMIGRPLKFGQEIMGVDQYKTVTDIIGEYNVPIIMDLDIGHLPPSMPLICGSMAQVKARENSITVTYEFR